MPWALPDGKGLPHSGQDGESLITSTAFTDRPRIAEQAQTCQNEGDSRGDQKLERRLPVMVTGLDGNIPQQASDEAGDDGVEFGAGQDHCVFVV